MSETNNLVDFNWDDSTSDSFFGVGTTDTSTQAQAKPADTSTDKEEEIVDETTDKDVDKTKPVTGDLTIDIDEDEDDFFAEVDKQNANKGTEPTKGKATTATGTTTTPDTEGSIYHDMYKDMKEIGIFKHIELPEDEEIDADRFYELQQEEYEQEVAARLGAWATKDLDEDAQAFIKFKLKGGNTADFLNTYSQSSDFTLGDTSDEDYQDDLIRYQLSKEGWDRDEIEDRLEILSKNGKKEKIAEKYHTRLENEQTEAKEALLEAQENQRKAARDQETKFKSTIKDTLETAEEINGIKFTTADKNDIFNYLTKRDKGDKPATEFQKGLSEVFNDPNKIVLLAKIIKSGFDFSSISKAAVTKKTKEVKRNIEQRQSIRTASSGSSLVEGGLASLFND